MKKQYFGDKRDLFKFDLIKNIVKETGVGGFTYIPMLTQNDKTKYAKNVGYKNRGLIEFFEKIHENKHENIKIESIEEYFKSVAIYTQIYTKDAYFTNENRDSYFKGIGQNLLQSALIFVDPDIGLEPVEHNEKHLLYSEVKSLYDNMGEYSILTIIQFGRNGDRRKDKIKETIDEKREELCKTTKDMCVFITDYKITFFCLARNLEIKRKLSKAVVSYKKEYDDNLDCGGIVL